jgi:hypothetical protein
MEETVIHEDTTHAPDPRDLVLTPEAQYYLNEGAGWAKFLGIAGFIGCGFILILAFFISTIFSMAGRMSPNPNPALQSGMGAFVGVIYGLMALLYFFPSLYVYQFGVNAKKGILIRDSADITLGISKLKSFLKFWGVLMIISLAFGVLGIIGLIAGAGALSHIQR